MKWLKDHKEFEQTKLKNHITKLETEKELLAADTTDWLVSQSKELEITRELNALKVSENGILEYNKKIQDIQDMKNDYSLKKKFHKILAHKLKKSDIVCDDNIKEKCDEEDLLPEEETTHEKEAESEDETEDKYEPLKVIFVYFN